MLKLSVFVLDGSKCKASAFIDGNFTLEMLRKQIKRMREEIVALSQKEEAGVATTLPKSMSSREKRIAHYQDLADTLVREKERLEKEQMEKVEAWEARTAESGKRPPGRKPKDPKDREVKEPTINPVDRDSKMIKRQRGVSSATTAS